MRAVVISEFGGPEVLRVASRPDPVPGRGEIVVRVATSGVNRADLLQRRGLYPPPHGESEVPGLEFAGTVQARGPGATRWRSGQHVMGIVAGGGYAEKVVVHETVAVAAPKGMDALEAGAIPEVYMTAYDAVFRQAGLASGETLLIHAVGSGVGTAALQLARRAGARVIGTSRAQAKLDQATEMGLDLALKGDGEWHQDVKDATDGRGADVILDLVGGPYLVRNQAAVATGGRHVVVGVPGGARGAIDLRLLMVRRARLLGTVLRARPVAEKAELARDFEKEVLPGFVDGSLAPVVDSVFPAERAAEAHERMEANRNFGKIVLEWGRPHGPLGGRKPSRKRNMNNPTNVAAAAVAALAPPGLLAALAALSALVAPAVNPLAAQTPPPELDPRIYEIVEAASPERVETDIRRLAGFGTRNTFSDTLSDVRGIGAARRWIKAEFDRISASCGGCYEVVYQRSLVTSEDSPRIPQDTWVVNVLAIKRGAVAPNRYVIMSGDIDSRGSSSSDGESDAPGANDNASGMAGAIEAARLLAGHEFGSTVVLAGLSGEEQGLWGGRHMAGVAREEGWEIVGVLNNDMIGNIEGVDGVIENNTFRVFSEPTPAGDTEQDHARYRVYGGEVDGPSRQLARYVARTADEYVPNLDPIMIYRLDRFGRGGHHRPFNDAGFPAVRIMETHENYVRQHQDLRTENGIAYGDVIEGVDFDYAAKMTALNAAVLAQLAWAPPAPSEVQIGGAVRPSTTLQWEAVNDPRLAGYKVYWRDTTAPQWQRSRWVGDRTSFTLEGIVIDNYLFGVAAVGADGNESPVAYPGSRIRRR